MSKLNKNNYATRDLIVTALAAALLVCGKFALQFIPNIEVVTLFLFVFAVSIGFKKTLYACLIFCALDNILYPASPDVTASYFTYFPLLVIVIAVVNRKQKNEYVNCVLAFFMTALFGMITSLYQSIIMSQSFIKVYLAGIVFYCVHIAGNTIIVLLLLKPISRLVKMLYERGA